MRRIDVIKVKFLFLSYLICSEYNIIYNIILFKRESITIGPPTSIAQRPPQDSRYGSRVKRIFHDRIYIIISPILIPLR